MGPLENVVSQDYPLKGRGRYLRAIQHDSLVVDIQKQIWYWNSKGIAGDMFDWLYKVRKYTKQQAKEYVDKIDPLLSLTRGFEKKETVFVNDSLVEAFFNLGKGHRDYWYGRGYTDSTIDLFQLGYSGDWYVIPIFMDGRFRNFQCRTPDKKMKHWYKGVGPLPFNMDYVKNKEWFVLTEGPVDAIMLMQHGIPAMSTNTGAGYFERPWIGKFKNLKEVWIIYDNDKAGRKGAKDIGNLFGLNARVYTFSEFNEGYDISDYFQDGGTGRDFKELIRRDGKLFFEPQRSI